MGKGNCKHPHAVEDGYFDTFYCEECEEHVSARDVHFDVSGTFHDEEDHRIILNVTEEDYVGKTWLGLNIQESNFVDGETACYINLSEDQVAELHMLLAKHMHNVNMKEIKKHEEANNG
ncbi:hypothetical protein BI004_gp132 [Bacillus phage NotTheCreek]|uniref:hypothetical protein n=1 Tax=Bacillus phage NotTheCreek TaxID=1805952 RepID=UPI0007A76BC0|nr:hypothetical protein BI004_gp132 [Bacillus phage NotTheCreek]AMW63352.1 hypothetical protein NOTTHECREEK_132 [Bacillus phage NotTheCreek]QDH50115.1 hypothetical protein ALPS_129 [Bacillus phage ALPS]